MLSVDLLGLICCVVGPSQIILHPLDVSGHCLGLSALLWTLEILVILENPKSVENKGESDHLLEILEN